MAAGVGMEVGQAGFSQAVTISAQLLEALIRLMESMQNERRYTDMDTRGFKAIMDYVKSGGGVGEMSIPSEFEDKMDSALRTQHCPFVKLSIKGDDGKPMTLYVTRDCDRDFANRAYDLFKMEIGKGFSEISPEKFFDLNQDQSIRRMELFDEAQIDVVRANLSMSGVAYSIIRNEQDPALYDILFLPRDEQAMEKAVKSMEYDFAGDDGQSYHDNLVQDISERRRFVQTAIPEGPEMKAIIDASNPLRFITVQGGKFTLHNLTPTAEKQRDGSIKSVIKDSKPITRPLHRNDLMKYVDGLATQKAVVVDIKDVPYIKSFAADGRAFVTGAAEFGKDVQAARDAFMKMPGYTKTKLKDVNDIGRIYTLEGVPEEAMADISQKMEEKNVLGDIAVIGNFVAFYDKDKKMMDKVLNETLYSGRSGLEQISDRFYYEGRGNLEFDNKDETYYIVSPVKDKVMRDFAIRITPESLDILKNDEITGQVERFVDGKDNPAFETTLTQLLGTFKDPVCLTKEEMQASNPEQIANSRTGASKHNDAVAFLKDYDRAKKDEIYQTKTPDKADQLDLKQGQAIKRYYEHRTTDTYVDRTMMEKVLDGTIDRKHVQEDKSFVREDTGELDR